MLEVLDIQINQDMIGQPHAYVGSVRIIDRSQGTFIGASGYELLNYDKHFTISTDDVDHLSELMGNRITEVLCNEF